MTGAQRRNRLGPEELRRRVRELWVKGLCSSQIAERLNYSTDYICQIASELGLAFKTAPRHRYDGIATTGRVFHRGRSAGAVMT